jgi:uncharacterized protein with NAD-binding domain and iron-sulfur cluster
MGGGMAGIGAALELIKRDFEGEVLERRAWLTESDAGSI